MKSYRSYLAGGGIFLLPLVCFPGFLDEFRTPKLIFLALLSTVVAALFVARTTRLSLGLSLGFCGFSAAFSGLAAPFQLNNLFFLGINLVFAYLVVNPSNDEIDRVFLGLTCAGWVSAFFAYLQVFHLDPGLLVGMSHPLFYYKVNEESWLPLGLLGQQTLFGPFLTSVLMITLFTRRYISAAVFLPLIFLTQSSFVYLGLGAGLFIFGLYRFHARRMLPLLGLVLLGALVMYFRYWYLDSMQVLLNDNGRFAIWREVLKKALTQPWFGHGFGTYPAYAPMFQDKQSIEDHGLFIQAHNDYLERFFEQGLLGMVFVFWLLCDFFKSVVRERFEPRIMCLCSVLCVYLADAGGNFPFRVVPQGTIALFAWVMVTTYRKDSYDEPLRALLARRHSLGNSGFLRRLLRRESRESVQCNQSRDSYNCS